MTTTRNPIGSGEGAPPICSSVTRRHFLAGLGASVAVAAAAGYGISVWGKNPAAAGPATTRST